MPNLTKEQEKKMHAALDQMFAALFSAERITAINNQYGLHLKPYQLHTEEELEKLYEIHRKDSLTKMAEETHAEFSFYQSEASKTYEKNVTPELKKGVKRAWAYALKKSTSKDPLEQEKTRKENEKILTNLLKPEEQKKFLKTLKNDLQKTDFTVFLSGNEEQVLEFAKNNMRAIGAGFIYEMELKPLFKQNHLASDEELKLMTEKKELLASGTMADCLAGLMTSDVYPLLQQFGDPNVWQVVYDFVNLMGTDNPVINAYNQEYNKHPQSLKGMAFHEMDQLKSMLGNVVGYYDGRQKLDVMENDLNDMIVAANNTSHAMVLSRNDDPTDYMIANQMFYRGTNRYPGTISKYEILEDVRRGEVVTIIFPQKDGPAKEPQQLLYDKNTGSLSLHYYYAEKTMERLKQLRTKMEKMGTKMTDSDEFTDMMKDLKNLTDSKKNFTNKEMLRAMTFVSASAEQYYFTKLDQKQNDTREARFEVACEIRELYNDLKNYRVHDADPNFTKKNKMLMEQLADKFAKGMKLFDIRTSTKKTKSEKAREEKALNTLAARNAFYKETRNYREVAEQIFAGKNTEQLERLRGMSMNQFMEEAQQLIAKPMQVREQPDQQPGKKQGPVMQA